jgi:hypothetical protein
MLNTIKSENQFTAIASTELDSIVGGAPPPPPQPGGNGGPYVPLRDVPRGTFPSNPVARQGIDFNRITREPDQFHPGGILYCAPTDTGRMCWQSANGR